jgi:hypothetical protein
MNMKQDAILLPSVFLVAFHTTHVEKIIATKKSKLNYATSINKLKITVFWNVVPIIW